MADGAKGVEHAKITLRDVGRALGCLGMVQEGDDRDRIPIHDVKALVGIFLNSQHEGFARLTLFHPKIQWTEPTISGLYLYIAFRRQYLTNEIIKDASPVLEKYKECPNSLENALAHGCILDHGGFTSASDVPSKCFNNAS